MLPFIAERSGTREQVSADPQIDIFRGLFAPEECAYLIRRAEPLLKPSFVDDGKSGIGRPDPIRTSHGAAFVPHEEDLVVQALNRRIAEAIESEFAPGSDEAAAIRSSIGRAAVA